MRFRDFINGAVGDLVLAGVVFGTVALFIYAVSEDDGLFAVAGAIIVAAMIITFGRGVMESMEEK